MTWYFQATKSQLADMKMVAEIGADRLGETLDKLSHENKPALSPEALFALVRKNLPDNAEHLVRLLLSLQGLIRQTNKDGQDVLAGVRAAIERQGKSEGLETSQWLKIEPVIAKLLDTQSVRLATKGMELAYDYANLLQRTKILTDIRPLYDQRGDQIEAAVVSYTLRLQYSNSDGTHDLSIALDENDIKQLIHQCERSLTKARAAKSMIQDRCNLGVTISGEAHDDYCP